MKLIAQWKQKMLFAAEADGHAVSMDAKAPFGADAALTPKQLILAAVCGCAGMDIAGLLKKHKQPVEEFTIEAVAKVHEEHPAVFEELEVSFRLKGLIDDKILIEAVHLSQSKYCSVSAMLAKAMPIYYKIYLNSELIGSGSAKFEK
ncbi:MAG: OsmC family protein [Bacteriovoracia bacterium]